MPRFIAETVLLKAIEEGTFDCSSQAGKALQLLENPFESPSDRLSFHILKEAGMRPMWIDLDLEIRNSLDQARNQLSNTFRICGAEGYAWIKAVDQFSKRIEAINCLIRELNLKVPHPRFQRALVRPDQEADNIRLQPR